MNKTFNLLFFVKKNKIKANGTAPIYLRITIDGKNNHKVLKDKSGAEFDRAFMKQMIDDHQRAITLFEDEVKNGQNEEMRTWASKKLVTLKKHLAEAQQIYNELNK